jgi:hypothetical protein
MNSRRDEEITASVGAHRDLGSEYDDVIAAGLVERIGAEVDRRVDERISQYQRGGRPAAGQAGTCKPVGFHNPVAGFDLRFCGCPTVVMLPARTR